MHLCGVCELQDPWIVKQCPGSLIKQGIVSHGARLRRVLPFALFVAFRRH